MENKLVFFDIDGTLMDSLIGIDDIPETTIEAIDQLRANGHRAIIATGRCQDFVVDSVRAYPFDGFVTCNGAYVSYQGECVLKHSIPLEAMQKAIDFANRNQTVLYLESSDKIHVVNGQKENHRIFAEGWQMKSSIQVHDFDVNQIETYIGMMILDDLNQIDEMISELSPYFDIQRHPKQMSFDLTLKNISKANGIKAFVDKVGYDMNEVFAFGDGNNDLEMIQAVGHGIAMGNAVDALKAIADDITDTIDKQGIPKALKKYKLI